LTITASDQRRDPFERTTHSETTDAKQLGLFRHGFLSFEINYVGFGDLTHQGLFDAIIENSEDLYEYDDGNGSQTSYGLVESFKFQGVPVDAVQRVRVGVLLIAEPPNLLIQEDDGGLLTEDLVDLELNI